MTASMMHAGQVAETLKNSIKCIRGARPLTAPVVHVGQVAETLKQHKVHPWCTIVDGSKEHAGQVAETLKQ